MDTAKMSQPINEKDEFLLNRLFDGDLPEHQADCLRERIRKEPALGEAFQAYARLNSSLADRKQDCPTVDWPSFHNSIMQSIKAQPAHYKTIRIGKWLLLGAPMAAAAAIVLLLTFYQGPTSKLPNGQDLNNARVVGIPHDAQADKIVIRYNRPALSKKSMTGTIKVSYGRSTEMAEATRKVDETHQSSPLGWGFGAVKTSSPVPAGDLMEMPPL